MHSQKIADACGDYTFEDYGAMVLLFRPSRRFGYQVDVVVGQGQRRGLRHEKPFMTSKERKPIVKAGPQIHIECFIRSDRDGEVRRTGGPGWQGASICASTRNCWR